MLQNGDGADHGDVSKSQSGTTLDAQNRKSPS